MCDSLITSRCKGENAACIFSAIALATGKPSCTFVELIRKCLVVMLLSCEKRADACIMARRGKSCPWGRKGIVLGGEILVRNGGNARKRESEKVELQQLELLVVSAIRRAYHTKLPRRTMDFRIELTQTGVFSTVPFTVTTFYC